MLLPVSGGEALHDDPNNGCGGDWVITCKTNTVSTACLNLRRVFDLTPSDWTFQVNALIFSPTVESLVATMIRSRTPANIKHIQSINTVKYQSVMFILAFKDKESAVEI